jgi:hypothetical protein
MKFVQNREWMTALACSQRHRHSWARFAQRIASDYTDRVSVVTIEQVDIREFAGRQSRSRRERGSDRRDWAQSAGIRNSTKRCRTGECKHDSGHRPCTRQNFVAKLRPRYRGSLGIDTTA